MADGAETFVSRWSRRKRGARGEDRDQDRDAKPREGRQGGVSPASAPAASGPADSGPAASLADRPDPEAGDPEVVAALPAIEDLNETSDFTPFMAKGVPEVLRRRALRKLWRINPLFAHLDGLNDYDEDFTDAAALLTEVKTIYKVGKGMVSDDEPAGPDAADAVAGTEAEARDSVLDREAQDEAGESAASGDVGGPDPAAAPTSDPTTDTAFDPAPEGPVTAELPKAALEAAVEATDQSPESGSAGESAPVEALPGRRNGSERRSAAARRWGESSG